jgi:mono/diheme cytochrome c family protein
MDMGLFGRNATIVAILTVAGAAGAQTPASIVSSYTVLAQRESSSFAGFSTQRGEQLFQSRHGSDWSCASCHTQNPLAMGRHARTGKPIPPLAPAANAERFTSPDKVEKWFRRNCNDVLGRACTTQDKGDVLAYLMSLKP